MALSKLRTYGPAAKTPMLISAGVPGAKRLVHIGVHNSANRNAGDTLLFPVVRRLFDKVLGPFDWELQQAWSEFDIKKASELNSSADGIVIGGGGLLLRDQAGSDVSNSGWQWNSTVAAVGALQIPLVIFAIGYNRFRGQADFDAIFTDHIQMVIKKSGFFGLRNTGSINALSGYLVAELAQKLRHQYCPTTVLWQLYPEYRALAEAHDRKRQRILAVNAAFDRSEMRFGAQQGQMLRNLALAVRAAEERGWEILVVAHKTMDRQIEPYLDAAGVSYETADLTDAGPEDVMAFYAEVDFAFGMRGHAQMIPFGLRRPIMSIISHDKMRFLLEDINRTTWGVEVDAPDLRERLVEMLIMLEENRDAVLSDVVKAQTEVWVSTLKNMAVIGGIY